MSCEQAAHGLQRGRQRVDVVVVVVQRQRGPRRRRHAEPIHQRLAAMVAGADGHALAIENRPHVVRVHAVEDE